MMPTLRLRKYYLLAALVFLAIVFSFSCKSWEGEEAIDDDDDDDDASDDVWEDSTSGLMWQNASDCCYRRGDAESYCQNLSLGEYDDWRLPSISELRSLIRGCDATETGGSCGVTDDCLEKSCRDDSCYECSSGDGPADGCYWLSELSGECTWYWSSSVVAGYDFGDLHAWDVRFDYGGVGYVYASNDYGGVSGVRCVR
jgi:Protein of unknown function (DUF1566)